MPTRRRLSRRALADTLLAIAAGLVSGGVAALTAPAAGLVVLGILIAAYALLLLDVDSS